MAASFQKVAIDELVRKTELAIKKYNIKRLIVAGGVTANKYLRSEMEKLADKHNINLTVPPIKYCTDNAAMIGCAAYPLYLKKDFADFSLNAESTMNLN